jgi:hypothetical protein
MGVDMPAVVSPTKRPIELALSYQKKKITQEHHDYELVVSLKNTGANRIDDWEIEVEFPTPLLDRTIHGIRVADRSNAKITLFRVVGRELAKPLRPGDEQVIKIGYFVNNDIYWHRRDLFACIAKARTLIDGASSAEVERPIEELQDF